MTPRFNVESDISWIVDPGRHLGVGFFVNDPLNGVEWIVDIVGGCITYHHKDGSDICPSNFYFYSMVQAILIENPNLVRVLE